MKNILIFLIVFSQSLSTKAQIYIAKDVYIHFFSPAPVADIEANSTTATGKLNLGKKEVSIEMMVSDFKFKKALMQAHFNEKYIETDKYPKASFKGKFKENLNLERDGTYSINIEGKFSIHGVERFKKIICNINVKDQNITFDSAFELLSADYKIKAPNVLYRKVGEEVGVDIKGNLMLDKK